MVGVPHAVATSSGTTALHLALLGYGIGPGDEVITVPFTFIASANSVLYTGARPVLVDVREDDFTIDVDQVEAAITPRTKAIMPVSLYGQPADLPASRRSPTVEAWRWSRTPRRLTARRSTTAGAAPGAPAPSASTRPRT